MKKQLGLLGRNIGYSFSRNYFSTKFENEHIANNFSYTNFDIPSVNDFQEVIKENNHLIGLNVTIPYKEEIIPFLGELSEEALKIGAINTIKVTKDKLIGYNTDYIGFSESLKPLLKNHHKKALILGTGGASKAVMYALDQLGIGHQLVSRKESQNTIAYENVTKKTFEDFQIIINCTPLGTFPNTDELPNIPYEGFSDKHIAYDLIYNPEKTSFLEQAEKKGATIKNGYEMLVLQAESAWKIWNS